MQFNLFLVRFGYRCNKIQKFAVILKHWQLGRNSSKSHASECPSTSTFPNSSREKIESERMRTEKERRSWEREREREKHRRIQGSRGVYNQRDEMRGALATSCLFC